MSGTRIVKSGFWSGASVSGVTLVQFARSMILARLLEPSDFGVVAFAGVFANLVFVFANFGLTASIVFKKDLKSIDLNTCWWGNFFVDGLASLVCILVALVAEEITGRQHLLFVVAFLAIQFLINGIANVNMALLRRKFMFKNLALINVSHSAVMLIVAFVAVKYLGMGFWGLLLSMVLGSVWVSTMSLLAMPWLPSFSFSWICFKDHFHYGKWLLGNSLIDYANNDIDRFSIGAFFNATQLGYYEYAMNMPMTIVNKLSMSINQVLFPAVSSFRDDLGRVRDLILKMNRANSLIIFPIMFGLGIVAKDFVLVAYGEKWLPIIAPLRVFCAAGSLLAIWGNLRPLCNGLGKTKLPFYWNLIGLPFNAGLIYLAVGTGSVALVACTKLAWILFRVATLRQQIMRVIGLPLWMQLKALTPALVSSLIMVIVISTFRSIFVSRFGELPLASLICQIIIGGLTYLGVIFLFFRNQLRGLRAMFKQKDLASAGLADGRTGPGA